MAPPLTGVVHGNTVVLDRELPPLDGHRVRVVLEDIDQADVALGASEQQRLWSDWEAQGDQGPITGNDPWPEDA